MKSQAESNYARFRRILAEKWELEAQKEAERINFLMSLGVDDPLWAAPTKAEVDEIERRERR